jgi:uncharacterized membrane-anchored protein YitT (DUF2179 family)
MTETQERSNGNDGRFRALNAVEKIRFVAFSIAVLGLLALNLLMTPPAVLLAGVTGWYQDLGTHQVHDMAIAAGLWVAVILPLVLLLYRPANRVNTILAPLAVAVPTAIMAFLAGSFLFPGFAIMSLLAVAAFLLHPAGRSAVRFDRVASVDRRVTGLLVVAAVPLLVYAGVELSKQLGPVNEHVVFVHYGGMANAALYVLLMGALAVFRQRDWRFATWSAGLIAAFVGLASIAYPASVSSLGLVGGGLLVIWAVAFVAVIEYVRRTSEEVPKTRDEPVPEPL